MGSVPTFAAFAKRQKFEYPYLYLSRLKGVGEKEERKCFFSPSELFLSGTKLKNSDVRSQL